MSHSEPELDQGAADAAHCRRTMQAVLASRIIPRLLAVSRSGSMRTHAAERSRIAAPQIEALARVCARGDREAAHACIAAAQDDGADTEAVFVDLVGPAALWLGKAWEDDRLSFADVTIGLTVLHELIHDLGYGYHEGPQAAGDERRIMLACAPGSQHVLGLSIVAELFAKQGWQVAIEMAATPAALCSAVREEWFDLIGLSVALDTQLKGLARLLAQLRAASRNPACPILLGGPVFGLAPRQPEEFGAQAICLDAREAVGAAQRLLAAQG
jgi:MerR family transcriptional regulator, light-induced transcriptional regulator